MKYIHNGAYGIKEKRQNQDIRPFEGKINQSGAQRER